MTATETDAVRQAVGAAVRDARRAAGLSMRALAASCGVSQPFISAIEAGQSAPSISTLYRIAEVLGTTPAELLPVTADDPVTVIRAGEGRLLPSSEHPGSAIGRVLHSDPDEHLEIYEYGIGADEDLDVWFDHPGTAVLHVTDGALAVDFEGREPVELSAGDWVVHPGDIPHRWRVLGSADVRLLLVVSRP